MFGLGVNSRTSFPRQTCRFYVAIQHGLKAKLARADPVRMGSIAANSEALIYVVYVIDFASRIQTCDPVCFALKTDALQTNR